MEMKMVKIELENKHLKEQVQVLTSNDDEENVWEKVPHQDLVQEHGQEETKEKKIAFNSIF